MCRWYCGLTSCRSFCLYESRVGGLTPFLLLPCFNLDNTCLSNGVWYVVKTSELRGLSCLFLMMETEIPLKLMLLEELFVPAHLVSQSWPWPPVWSCVSEMVSEDILVVTVLSKETVAWFSGGGMRRWWSYVFTKTFIFDLWWLPSCPCTCQFGEVAVNSSYQSVAVGRVWGAIITILHHDGAASGVVSSQDQRRFPTWTAASRCPAERMEEHS